MEKVREGQNRGQTETFYADVSLEDAQGLLRQAREFIDPSLAEVTGETTIVRTTMFSAQGGMVKRAVIEYDMTHQTAELKTEISSETTELYHKGH